MIIDSYIWKYELKKEINEIVFFFDNADFNDDSEISHLLDEKAFIKLQKFTIYTSIIIRKLIEAHKISFELLGENFSIISYQKNPNEKITYWNSFEIEKIYHLDTPVKVNISIKDLVDKIIHSFHFMPKYNWQKIDVLLPDDHIENWTNEGFEGFYFSSDKSKNKDLLFISFEKYVEILKNISTDFIIRKTYEGDKIVLNSRTKEK